MAKRMSSTIASPTPKVASKKSNSMKLGEALGAEMQKIQEHPAMTPQASTPMDTAREMTDVSDNVIAQRAYELWKSQGGSDLENWLKAERELRADNIVAT